MSAETLFGRAERQLSGLRGELDALEAAGAAATAAQTAQLASGVAALQLTVRSIEESPALQRETDMALRTAARTRVRALRAACDECRARLERHGRATRPAGRAGDAAPLLPGAPHAGGGGDVSARHAGGPDALHRAEASIAEYISIGAQTLEGLRAQGRTLRGARATLGDAVGELGVGRAVMRMIRRRSQQDMVVFFLGTVLVLVVVYLLFFRWA